MSPKRRQDSGTNRPARILVLAVGGLMVVLAIAVLVTWMTPAPAPVASGGPPVTMDPRVVAAELVPLAPELTQASAEMLARAMPGSSGPPLAEMGLLFATRGFDRMERADLLELGALLDELYATLPPPDRDWMRGYMHSMRDGTLTKEASVRGRQLLTQAVNLLPPERRARLQTLIEKATRAAVDARRIAENRTPPPATPVAAPMVGFQPQPPNSPGPEPAGLTPSQRPSPAKDEAYWRGRMKEARDKVAKLKEKVDELDRITQQDLVSTSKWVAELGKAREELAAAERAIGDLEEEGRRAGALPGWLREQ